MDPIKSPIKTPVKVDKEARDFAQLFPKLEKLLAYSKPDDKAFLTYFIKALDSFKDGSKRFLNIIRHLNSAQKQLDKKAPVTVFPSHSYVEMGDGLKWADCNVGASKPEEYGDFYAWGETKPFYTSINPKTFKEGRAYYGYEYNKHFVYDSNGENSFRAIKYSAVDRKEVLEAVDDAASANWGSKWRTPTKKEWEALMDSNNFTWKKEQKNGVDGYTVTSKVKGYVGNSIFLPMCPHFIGEAYLAATINPGYWTATLPETTDVDNIRANLVIFQRDKGPVLRIEGRYQGYPVRAVSQ